MTDLKGKGKESQGAADLPSAPTASASGSSIKQATTVAEDDDDDLDELDDVLE